MPRWPERTALDRFLAKCQHDAATGCVVWIGGKTQGRGHHVPYGAFKFEGRRWFAHRWAAKFIHGFEIDGLQVDHRCLNTLCVQHLEAVPANVNRERQAIHLQVGLLDYEEVYGPPHKIDTDGIPFYTPPSWFPTPAPSGDPPF